jgi:hypothetical protein
MITNKKTMIKTNSLPAIYRAPFSEILFRLHLPHPLLQPFLVFYRRFEISHDNAIELFQQLFQVGFLKKNTAVAQRAQAREKLLPTSPVWGHRWQCYHKLLLPDPHFAPFRCKIAQGLAGGHLVSFSG